MLRHLPIFCLMLAGAAANAAPLAVQVVDSNGKPVRNAVVAFRPSPTFAKAMPLGSGYAIGQKDMEFRPFVAVVPVGATVSFPNFDPTKHHVYSFSPVKKFELKLFAKDQSRKIRFDKAGIVPLGCNIHDSMAAFLYVSDTAWTVATDRAGTARFADAPASGNLTIWHPYMRAPGNQLVRPIGSANRAVRIAVRLRPPPMHSMSGY